MLKLSLCFFPGLALLAYSAYALGKDLLARKWPFVEGKVISTNEDTIGGEGIAKIVISYEYLVNGLRYTGKRYSFGYLSGAVVGSGEVHSKIKRDLPDHPKVKVFYNPAKPTEALLVPSATWIHLIDFLVSGAFLLSGLAVYVLT